MTHYWTIQLLFGLVYALEAAFLVWRYHATIGRPLELRSLQQRLFALRDGVIFLVAEGKFREEDPDWQTLYGVVNNSAKASTVGEIRSGRSLIWKILSDARPPTREERDRFAALPPELQDMWLRYVLTVISIFVEGSRWFRTVLFLAKHWQLVKRWLERSKPKEVERYREWQESASEFKRGRKPPLGGAPASVSTC